MKHGISLAIVLLMIVLAPVLSSLQVSAEEQQEEPWFPPYVFAKTYESIVYPYETLVKQLWYPDEEGLVLVTWDEARNQTIVRFIDSNMSARWRLVFPGEYPDYVAIDNELNGIPALVLCTYNWTTGENYTVRRINLLEGYVIKTKDLSSLLQDMAGIQIASPYMYVNYLEEKDLLIIKSHHDDIYIAAYSLLNSSIQWFMNISGNFIESPLTVTGNYIFLYTESYNISSGIQYEYSVITINTSTGEIASTQTIFSSQDIEYDLYPHPSMPLVALVHSSYLESNITVLLYNASARQLQGLQNITGQHLYSVAGWAPQKPYLVLIGSGSSNYTLNIINGDTGEILINIEMDNPPILSTIKWSPDNNEFGFERNQLQTLNNLYTVVNITQRQIVLVTEAFTFYDAVWDMATERLLILSFSQNYPILYIYTYNNTGSYTLESSSTLFDSPDELYNIITYYEDGTHLIVVKHHTSGGEQRPAAVTIYHLKETSLTTVYSSNSIIVKIAVPCQNYINHVNYQDQLEGHTHVYYNITMTMYAGYIIYYLKIAESWHGPIQDYGILIYVQNLTLTVEDRINGEVTIKIGVGTTNPYNPKIITSDISGPGVSLVTGYDNSMIVMNVMFSESSGPATGFLLALYSTMYPQTGLLTDLRSYTILASSNVTIYPETSQTTTPPETTHNPTTTTCTTVNVSTRYSTDNTTSITKQATETTISEPESNNKMLVLAIIVIILISSAYIIYRK